MSRRTCNGYRLKTIAPKRGRTCGCAACFARVAAERKNFPLTPQVLAVRRRRTWLSQSSAAIRTSHPKNSSQPMKLDIWPSGRKKAVKTVAPIRTRAVLRSLIRNKRQAAYVAYLSWHKVPIILFLVWSAMNIAPGKTVIFYVAPWMVAVYTGLLLIDRCLFVRRRWVRVQIEQPVRRKRRRIDVL